MPGSFPGAVHFRCCIRCYRHNGAAAAAAATDAGAPLGGFCGGKRCVIGCNTAPVECVVNYSKTGVVFG